MSRRDVATTLFVVLSVLVYAALWLAGVGPWGAVRPAAALRWGALAGTLGGQQPWRFLSAMFVHFGLMHFAFNTLTLHQLGRDLEGMIGWARFVLVFVGTGVAGFLASELWYAQMPLTGGTSGGIFGLLGAAVGWRYSEGDPDWKRLAITGAGYAVAMVLLDRMSNLSVNHAAHVGGLVAGAGIGWVLHRLRRGAAVERALTVTGALLIVASFVSIGLSLALTPGRPASPWLH
ncbi:MAG TPA: rhomboid family intramembrane serine protease [Polyangiaceae bacterium]|nr:rhomboid family intramembrane serine protease [Polyangiaceae bacterium]